MDIHLVLSAYKNHAVGDSGNCNTTRLFTILPPVTGVRL